MKKFLIAITFLIFIPFSGFAQKTRSISLSTLPNSTVWIDEVKRGTTDSQGKIELKLLPVGIRKLRIRAYGYKEVNQNVLPTESKLTVNLVKTTDSAEIAFQDAEKISSSDRLKAIELYQKAISLRPKYAEAYVAMARAMSETGNTDDAHDAIRAARKIRLIYPEASAVDGRIYKSDDEIEKAIASYKRAIREGKGFQPEAHTGIGLIYKEKAESASARGDFAKETENYQIASTELKTALTQLGGTELVLYEQLGGIYEKMHKYAEAINVYEDYLKYYPDTNAATTFRSYIVQLKKQIDGQ